MSRRECVKCNAKSVEKKRLSPTVVLLTLKVPDPDFEFKAGQWVDFSIPDITTVGGFSICSPPSLLHRHQLIQIAIRKSSFPPAKWVHNKLEVGDHVEITVGGDFFFDPEESARMRLPFKDSFHQRDPSNLLLIGGGVGISPLSSIFQHSYDLHVENDVYMGRRKVHLLHSAASVDELLFKDIFDGISKKASNFTCNYFVTKQNSLPDKENDKSVVVGRITNDAIRKTVELLGTGLQAYLCGPPPMIEIMEDYLLNSNVRKENVFYERWW